MDHDDDFERIREFYDEEYYGQSTSSRSRLPWHYKKIASRLRPVDGNEVLDVACGTGDWLEYFRAAGARVSGIDLSEKAIAECRRRFPGSDFHCGPAETLPFKDRRFDLVTCMGSLEHFLDKPRALREMVRVAQPNAEFLILVPNAGFLTRQLGLYGGTNQAKIQEEVLDLQEWARLLENAGLRVLKKWSDLHPLSWQWIRQGRKISWPLRALQALALCVWPLRWQYQVYFYCKPAPAP